MALDKPLELRPPKAAASETAPARVLIVDASSAVSEMVSAMIPVSRSPSMKLLTLTPPPGDPGVTPPPGDPGVMPPVAGTMDPGLPAVPDGCARKDGWVSSRGTCPIDTGLMGDETCLVAPAADKGFQIHVGPPDTSNPGAFAVAPGQEDSVCFGSRTPNGEKIFYQPLDLVYSGLFDFLYSFSVTRQTFGKVKNLKPQCIYYFH